MLSFQEQVQFSIEGEAPATIIWICSHYNIFGLYCKIYRCASSMWKKISILCEAVSVSLTTSQPTFCFTVAPTGRVQNLRFDGVTSSSIRVVWDAVSCLERNGVISGHRIQYGIITTSENNLTLRTGHACMEFPFKRVFPEFERLLTIQ